MLSDALDKHKGVGPGFHLLRHALAILILALHAEVAFAGQHSDKVATATGTYVKGQSLNPMMLMNLDAHHMIVEILRPALFVLVGMFFALSGFLVVGSALRTTRTSTFFANRALRILPALAVETLLSAFILGPLLTEFPLQQYFSNPKLLRYLGNIIGEVSFQLPGLFIHNPWSSMVNANLWTLPSELGCYALMLLCMVTGLLYRTKLLTGLILGFTVGVLLVTTLSPNLLSIRDGNAHFSGWYIILMFFFGVLLFIHAHRVPLDIRIFIPCALAFYLMTLFNFAGALSGIPLAYCMVYIGMLDFTWFDRAFRDDLSYGIYLYGFPITQSVILLVNGRLLFLPASVRYWVLFVLILGLTAAFASVSWRFIEKPALSLRRYFKPKASSPSPNPSLVETESHSS